MSASMANNLPGHNRRNLNDTIAQLDAEIDGLSEVIPGSRRPAQRVPAHWRPGRVQSLGCRRRGLELVCVVERIPDGPLKVGLVAIAAGRVPELAESLPRRPSDAGDCRVCAASGWLPSPWPRVQYPECNGRGWLPPQGIE